MVLEKERNGEELDLMGQAQIDRGHWSREGGGVKGKFCQPSSLLDLMSQAQVFGNKHRNSIIRNWPYLILKQMGAIAFQVPDIHEILAFQAYGC